MTACGPHTPSVSGPLFTVHRCRGRLRVFSDLPKVAQQKTVTNTLRRPEFFSESKLSAERWPSLAWVACKAR